MNRRALTQAAGVSGFEYEIRSLLREAFQALADEVRVDSMGNLIAIKRGVEHPERTVMACAHMDEVGFIIQGADENGMLRFMPVGGMDLRILVSARVLIGKARAPGVIGCKAIHLQEPEERKTPLKLDQLYIDIGASSREQALAAVQPGDAAIFDSGYVEFGEGCIKARALDDRVGCAMLLSALEQRYPVTLAAVFSCQEEIGTGGAQVAAYAVDPDMALVLEGTTCADMHGVRDHLRVTRLGRGPVIAPLDRYIMADVSPRQFIARTAEAAGIPWQNREGVMGGTDGGVIQRARGGIPVAHISIPTRYIHSPVCVVARRDVEQGAALLRAVLQDSPAFLKGKVK